MLMGKCVSLQTWYLGNLSGNADGLYECLVRHLGRGNVKDWKDKPVALAYDDPGAMA